MLRKWGSVFLMSVFLLMTVITDCSAELWWAAWQEGYRALVEMEIPQGYEGFEWERACDFSYLRDIVIPIFAAGPKTREVLLDTNMSQLVGGAVGCAFGVRVPEGLLKAEREKKGLVASLFADIAEKLDVDESAWEDNLSLPEQVKRFASAAGISDHYAFGEIYPAAVASAKAARPVVEKDPLQGRLALPLGARVEIRTMGMPGSRLQVEELPLLRLQNPWLDFEKLGSRIWEYDITGKLQTSTVSCVFAREKFQGDILSSPEGIRYQRLQVHPETAESGGQIVGRILLSKIPGVGLGGIRRVYLSSPANEGMLFKDVLNELMVIVLTEETVNIEGSSGPLRLGDILELRVKIRGLEKNCMETSLQEDSWLDIVSRIFKGASLEGAGIGNISIDYDWERRETIIRCRPTQRGVVSLILQTFDGPLVLPDVATILGSSESGF